MKPPITQLKIPLILECTLEFLTYILIIIEEHNPSNGNNCALEPRLSYI